ncbi:hypothetical protein D0T12_05310 [Actinomadura spongiicola]|uniref:Bacterial transcriptional activator domain-containing protein n=2 Tax=Actinomadura spongiicola TaxID=2303421 RepID=A0A372GLJ6_9ACTN|nr:hypothetical protein D0T12_05310 [Actinomadura spongiicola]
MAARLWPDLDAVSSAKRLRQLLWRMRGRWDRLRLLATLGAQVDELAEAPQRVLVQAHPRRGDTVTAYRAYLDYDATVRRELGVEPGPALRDLVSGLR